MHSREIYSLTCRFCFFEESVFLVALFVFSTIIQDELVVESIYNNTAVDYIILNILVLEIMECIVNVIPAIELLCGSCCSR